MEKRNKITEYPFLFCETKLFTRASEKLKITGVYNKKKKSATSFNFLYCYYAQKWAKQVYY